LVLVEESNISTRKSVEIVAHDKTPKEKSKFEPEDCPKEAREYINDCLDPKQNELLNFLWKLEPQKTTTSNDLAEILNLNRKETVAKDAGKNARVIVCTTNNKLGKILASTRDGKEHPIIENINGNKKGPGQIGSYRLSSDAKVRIRAITRPNRND
jgi:hypothetical protein